jgi:hypothetical protein
MLIAVGGSAALSDVRGPEVRVRPVTVPSMTAAVADAAPATNQGGAPSLATLSVSTVR